MRLDTLEIYGFKSFADRTTLRFNPGITAVVGPNGCGKTNVTEAIRWVLGERRPTALRGSSMQEVIFNGSRERKPLGMAEVTLSFTNALGLIPLDYSEVAVTRRIFRDGESHYFINKAPCNLQDIRDLFMGTGVGSSAYSLIEQRMVDAILSDRAEERRFLFDEAAGVTRYKARLQATLRKLEATENDLVRVGDILSEVRKTTGSLRRQMGKARRFEELQREELRLAVALAGLELSELAAQEVPLRETIGSLEEELARGADERTAREAELERLERELGRRRARERELRQDLEEELASLQSLEREQMLAEEGRRRAASEVERLTREISEHGAQAQALVGQREAMAGALSRAAAEAETGRAEAEACIAVVNELTARFEAAQTAFKNTHVGRERLSEERVRAEAELARAVAQRRAVAARRAELAAALAAERGKAGGERLAVETAVPETSEERSLGDRLAALRELVTTAAAELRARGRAHAEAQRALAALEGELGELAARRREIAARLETLEELKEGLAGFGEGARRALEARHAIAPGLRGPLSLEVEVADPRYAPAIEAYLDLFLDALLTPESEEAHAVLAFWRERNQAGAVWPLSDTAPMVRTEIDAAAREMLLCLGTQAAGLRGDLDRHRDALFGRLLLAEDLERATELRRRLNSNGSAGWYVVAALTGEILEPSGMVRLPHRKSEGNGDGLPRLGHAEQLKAALAEIAGEVQAIETRGERLRAEAFSARDEERAAQEQVATYTAQLEAAERERDRLRTECEAARTRAVELADQLAGMDERLVRESASVEAASTRAREIRLALEDAEAERAAREAELEGLRMKREAALRELGGADLIAQQRAAALASLQREDHYLLAGEDEQKQRATAKGAELEREREQVLAFGADAARLAACIEERRLRLEELRGAHEAQEEAIQALDAERFARDGEARAAHHSHEEATQRLHVEEMRLSDVIHRRQSIRGIVETEFGQSLEELQARIPMPEGGHGETMPDADLVELRERLRAVRERQSALGPVNLLALEEFTRETERLEFLESQHADLVHARDGLKQAIRKINATASDLFFETLARVRQNFQVTFTTLFEGGRADITLVDEGDPLESPIEISASPRGKRIQGMNLLSGGERALTALALLFAIYLVKPSPFCILDEVDAPLDDANIARFLRMIRGFSERTQFIIVTHNKRTMEASDYLYGVTMEEPGVSTLVSVDFERRDTLDYDAISAPSDAAGISL